jgi:hypothetical protein
MSIVRHNKRQGIVIWQLYEGNQLLVDFVKQIRDFVCLNFWAIALWTIQ